ncbi:hypothetical protein SAMN05216390_101144 [Lachnospiraceae bacterium KH1T2]|nr:hypothetical protein SAMN05216390_101144 [Lachnospiraceae bacterium KH1T2]
MKKQNAISTPVFLLAIIYNALEGFCENSYM